MTTTAGSNWQRFKARIVPGYQVASGRGGDIRFPGGTVPMQTPHFRARGLDLAVYYPATINVSIAPCRYQVRSPRVSLTAVKWHPTEPAEDFSFFDVRLFPEDGSSVDGLIYYPHPETKPKHFQQPYVLELLFPYVHGISYGADLQLAVPTDQMIIEEAS